MKPRLTGCLLIAVLLTAVPATAGAPENSLRPLARHSAVPDSTPKVTPVRPRARPEATVVGRLALTGLPPLQPTVRPVSRPVSEQIGQSEARLQTAAFLGPDVSVRPFLRPPSVLEEVLFGRRKKRRGSVCGDIDIQGKKIGRVPGRLNGCGIRNAVQITSISDVKLSRPATMDCTTAKSLNRWVNKGVIPAFRGRGGVVELKVAAHYTCRTRNNRRGARISEHGRGKAIDISAFTMRSGKVVTVLNDWGKGAGGRALRRIWRAACGPFGTVLGPSADRYHRDHFHMDTARHRGGPYCK